jgi:hypothetical protein
VIAASTSADPSTVSSFLTSLGKFAAAFDSAEKRETEDVTFVAKTFGQREEDVREWLQTVQWYGEQNVVESKVVLDTLTCVSMFQRPGGVARLRLPFLSSHLASVLEKAGVVTRPAEGWNVSDFVNEDVAEIQ